MWWPFKSKAEKEEVMLEALARINKVNRYIYNTIKDAEEKAFAASPSFETCHDCGGKFLEEKMQEVSYEIDIMGGRLLGAGHIDTKEKTIYFCLSHKKSYGLIRVDILGQRKYYKTIPAQEVECDENGKIIKGK